MTEKYGKIMKKTEIKPKENELEINKNDRTMENIVGILYA